MSSSSAGLSAHHAPDIVERKGAATDVIRAIEREDALTAKMRGELAVRTMFEEEHAAIAWSDQRETRDVQRYSRYSATLDCEHGGLARPLERLFNREAG